MGPSKLRGASGETIVETLVSILISALALMVLATVIGTSVRMVDQSRNHMNEFYKAESQLQLLPTPTGAPEKLSVDVPLRKGETTISVDVYGTTGVESAADIVYYERSEP